jgi:hypothetical protein
MFLGSFEWSGPSKPWPAKRETLIAGHAVRIRLRLRASKVLPSKVNGRARGQVLASRRAESARGGRSLARRGSGCAAGAGFLPHAFFPRGATHRKPCEKMCPLAHVAKDAIAMRADGCESPGRARRAGNEGAGLDSCPLAPRDNAFGALTLFRARSLLLRPSVDCSAAIFEPQGQPAAREFVAELRRGSGPRRTIDLRRFLPLASGPIELAHVHALPHAGRRSRDRWPHCGARSALV